ncbi:MAG: hypothetical protein IT429_02455 [Gemmataceae bacterium]|nr:hypothetical protein [Gemmataceae bacterium]
MAKTCSTCDRSYPDHLPTCPHCNPATPPADETLRLADEIDIVADESGLRTPPVRTAETRAPQTAGEIDLGADEETLEVAEAVPDEEIAAAKEAVGAGAHEDSGVLEVAEVSEGPASSGVIDVSAAGSGESPSDAALKALSADSGVFEVTEPAEITASDSGVIEVSAVEGGESPSDVALKALSADSGVLEVAEVVEATEGPASSGVIEVAAVEEVESPSGAALKALSADSGVLEVAEVVEATEGPASGSGVIDLTAADVVESPSGSGLTGLRGDSGVIEVSAAEVIEEPASAEEVLEVAEAEAAIDELPTKRGPIPIPPAPAAPPQKGVAPTRIGTRAPAATMLASGEELAELGGPAPPPESPTAAAPPKKGAVPPTRLGTRSPAPTMLADTSEPAELPGGELGGTRSPRDLPSMELDSGKIAKELTGEDAPGMSDQELIDAAASSSEEFPEEEILEASEVEDETLALDAESARAGQKLPETPSGFDMLAGDLFTAESDVDLGKSPPRGERPSGVDLIAEGIESGVGLTEKVEPPAPSKPRRKGASHVVLGDVPDESPESSSLNLTGGGRRPSAKAAADEVLDVEEAEEVVEEAGEVVEDQTLAEQGVEDAIDELFKESADAEGTSSKRSRRQAAEVVGEDALIEDAEEVAEEEVVVPRGTRKSAAAASTAVLEEPSTKKPGRKERQSGGLMRSAGTLLLGVLLTAGGAAAVWYFAPNLIPDSPAGYKMQPITAGIKTPVQPPGPVETPLTEAHKLIREGNFDAAIEKVKDSPDSPEKRALGEALWLKYLAENKGPLNREDKLVEEAAKALKEADDKAFLGLIDRIIEADKSSRDLAVAKKAADDALANAAKAEFKGKSVAELAADWQKKKEMADDLVGQVKKLEVAKKALDDLAKDLKTAPDKVPATVAALEATRKGLDGKLIDINAKLKAAGIKEVDEKGVLDLVAARDTLEEQKKQLDAAVDRALDELKGGNLLPGGDGPKKLEQLVAGVKAACRKAESPLAEILTSSLAGLGSAVRELWAQTGTLEQRLDTWIALNRDRTRKDASDLSAVAKSLEWIKANNHKVTPETRARALYALGLAQRNQGQFADAVGALKQAIEAAQGLKTPPAWAELAEDTLKELTDPKAYFLPRARQLREEGRLKDALSELNTGLQAIPGSPRLAALRGLVRVELGEGAGKPDVAVVEQVRQDAATALKDPAAAAQGYYLLGRLEERLNQLDKAEASYRKALEVHKGAPAEASEFRTALGRLLLRERPALAIPEPAPKGKATETSRLTPADDGEEEEVAAADPRAVLVVLALVGVQPPIDEEEDPELAARLRQTIDLASELLKAASPRVRGEGYMLLGQALARQGKRNEGIKAYVKGLELYYPGRPTKELVQMVERHPAFDRPDALARYNVELADRHFGKGLEYYWARRYPEAEAQFKQAIGYYDLDARFHYYLGLARHQQKTRAKREAAALDFAEGARLESMSRPHSVRVNASLERLQGPLRQILNGYRQKLVGAR